MGLASLPSHPPEALRVKIDRVLGRIREGLHRSRVVGSGYDFRGFQVLSPGDRACLIDLSASLKQFPDGEDYLVRNSFGEQRISVTVVLDAQRTMSMPPLKIMQAGDLFWLFAFSAFRTSDFFRVIVAMDDCLLDSGNIRNRARLEEFLETIQQENGRHLWSRSYINPIAMLADSGLRDSCLVMISDFCGRRAEEFSQLEQLNMHGRNIRGVCIAIDEWAELGQCGWGVEAFDTFTGNMRWFSGRDLERTATSSDEFLENLRRKLSRHPVLFVRIPLLSDAVSIFCRSAFSLELA